jgi:hypothetical protein
LIHVTGIAQAPLEHVLKHLRDDDQQEMEAVRGKFDPNWVASELCRVTDGWPGPAHQLRRWDSTA